MRETLVAVLFLIVTGCSDSSDLSVEQACEEQAEVFCAAPCWADVPDCRVEYADACAGVATDESVPVEEHEICLEEMSESDGLCRYPVTVPASCWLN